MSEKDSLSPREQKRLADAQTPYLTFLPRQAEGFDPGLHTQTGILTDGGAQPRRWLEDFSLHLDTLGAGETAFAIPDALAVEQMTRRLLRLPPEADVSALGAWRPLLQAEFDRPYWAALCAAVERALPGEAEPERAAGAAPDWNARLRSLAGRRAEPGAFSALAREYGELPAEAADEDEALARYRAALVREMRAVLLDLCRGLERCSAPADRKQYAENALRRLDVLSAGSLPVRQEWEEARALLRQAAAHPEDLPWQQRLDQIDRAPEKARKRLLREVEGQLPPAAAGEDPALTELRRRAGAQGWKERLDAFNALTREEDKRAFAQGPKGDLPAEAEGEDVNLTILRLLLEPYRGDLFSQAQPEDDGPEDDSPEDDAPPPEEEDDAPPRRRRKRPARRG